MALVRIIPTLTLMGTGLVKTRKFKNPTYIGDPINTIRIFNLKEVDEIILLDITATVDKKKPNYPLIQDIASECFMPLAYGGGIKSLEQARNILVSGIEKIVLNSIVFENPTVVKSIIKEFGSSTVVICIDVKKNFFGKQTVYTCSATKDTKVHPLEWARKAQDFGAGEVVINSIDRDGEMVGYDIELIDSIVSELDIPVIALGGAGEFRHFEEVILKTHVKACAAGSMFVFKGKHRAVLISYPPPDKLSSLSQVV